MVRYVRFYTRWHRRENDQFSTLRCTKTGSTQPKLSAACFVVQSCLADADFVVFSNYCLIGTRQKRSCLRFPRVVFMWLIQSSDFKPVSNAPYRLNILRFRRVELDLLTDLLNMHGNRRDISQRLHIPDLAEEFFLGKYMVRVLC